jgi:hypothetical protein
MAAEIVKDIALNSCQIATSNIEYFIIFCGLTLDITPITFLRPE